MKAITSLIDSLEKTPDVLRTLLNQIPESLYKVRRLKNKWSIHEQVCHLVEAQTILIGRFKQFESEQNPLIRAYAPPLDRDPDHYLNMNFKEAIIEFPQIRKEMISMFRGYNKDYWKLEGRHELFSPYNTKLLLIHTLNVDYAHFFSIEQLGLTKAAFEEQIITIP